MSESWRLFVALELPPDVLDGIEKMQDDLKKDLSRDVVRWVRPQGVHLTLKFLGDVEVDRLDIIKASLDQSAENYTPLDLHVDGLGCFPNMKRPRVLWLGVGGDLQHLEDVYRSVEDSMTALGFDPDNRAFKPHLTLARAQRSASRNEIARIGEVAERTQPSPIPAWRVDAVSLMRSELKPGGAVYTELHRAGLDG